MTDLDIRFCTTSDGVRIAYTVLGEGYPLLFTPGWVSHLEFFLSQDETRAQMDRYARHFRVIVYDKRGTGLSDRGLADYSPETRAGDIEGIVRDLKLKRIALSGFSEGGPVAMVYAAKHPRSVSHLLLRGTLAYGGGERMNKVRSAIAELVRAQWGLGSDTLANLLVPEGDANVRKNFQDLQRVGATRDDAARMLEAMNEMDVRPLLSKITAKTLVTHGRDDKAVPFELGREAASLIRGARFVPLDAGHVVDVIDLAIEFLSDVARDYAPPNAPPTPSAALDNRGGSLVTIVFTDVERNTEILQRLGDAAWRDLLREHERITRDLLKQHAGDEIKTIGDAFMASFGSTSKALECAVALQRAFALHNEDADHPLNIRIGVNAGEPIAEDGDLFGTSVTTASRIAGMAAGGEIVVSNVVRELVAGKGFLFTDRGDTALRGFEDPVRLYELRWQP